MNYNIIVRSYNRPDRVFKNTIAMLEKQDNDLISRVLIYVANEEQKKLYDEEALKVGFDTRNIRIGCIGGANVINHASREFPDGHPLFFIDDDIKEFSTYLDINDTKSKVVITNLEEYLIYGFEVLRDAKAGAFSFNYTNPFYQKGKSFAELSTRRVCGGFFGTLNGDHVYSSVQHEDDNWRSGNMLSKFGWNLTFNWFQVKMEPMFTNPGGMSDYGRHYIDDSVDRVISEFPMWFSGKEEVNGLMTCKPYGVRDLKKRGLWKCEELDKWQKYSKESAFTLSDFQV